MYVSSGNIHMGVVVRLLKTCVWMLGCMKGNTPRNLFYSGADRSLARPGKKQANVSVRMARISFSALPCNKKKKLDDSCVTMPGNLRASLTCFRACFLPGRAKDLSAPRYNI